MSDVKSAIRSALLQKTVVRVYKVVGLVALATILLGLIGFLTVNVYFFFDRSWIRPVILSPQNERVVEANSRLTEQVQKRDEIISKRKELETELASLSRRIEVLSRFDERFGQVPEDLEPSPQVLLAQRELDRTRLEHGEALDRREVVERRLRVIESSLAQQSRLVEALEESPYLRAIDSAYTVAFVPYDNLDNVTPGQQIYHCKWGLIRCSEVGEVVSTLEGEVTDKHPHNGERLRGLMVELRLRSQSAAEAKALFLGGRPFWLL